MLVAVLVAAAVLAATVLLRPSGSGPGAASGASSAADPVASALVVATASCLAADPRDTVAVEVAGVRREMPLEACGNRTGARVDVRVSADGPAPGGTARVVGLGSDRPAGEEGSTPAASRLSTLLAVAAGVGGAALLVAVGRDRRRPHTLDLPRPRTSGAGGVPPDGRGGGPGPGSRRSAGGGPRR